MNAWEAIAVVGAGLAAGTVNAIVGSGTLITFPALLGLGYETVTANVTNTVGLLPGGLSAVAGSGPELRGQRARMGKMAAGSVAGSLTGATLLLTLPSSVFDGVVPVLIIVAALMMGFQPMIARGLARRRGISSQGDPIGWGPVALTFLAGIYGGYFGAAQGVILLAALSILVPDELRRTNALKNVLATIVNAVAAVFFVVFANPVWVASGLLAAGAIIGGAFGVRIARWIHPQVLRWIVVVVGLAVGIKLLLD